MAEASYSLNDLADATGIEARTIRSYIERGLLPNAETRGRAATYSKSHLSRLQVIMSLRRARPDIGLSEIRVVLQGLTPLQIDALANGSIVAATRVIDDSIRLADEDLWQLNSDRESEVPTSVDWERSSMELTGTERLVFLLREVSGFKSAGPPSSKVEQWERIVVTPDVELSVRANFDANQLAAFRELADLLRHLLLRTDPVSKKGCE